MSATFSQEEGIFLVILLDLQILKAVCKLKEHFTKDDVVVVIVPWSRKSLQSGKNVQWDWIVNKQAY